MKHAIKSPFSDAVSVLDFESRALERRKSMHGSCQEKVLFRRTPELNKRNWIPLSEVCNRHRSDKVVLRSRFDGTSPALRFQSRKSLNSPNQKRMLQQIQS